jgi:hypothetical protein
MTARRSTPTNGGHLRAQSLDAPRRRGTSSGVFDAVHAQSQAHGRTWARWTLLGALALVACNGIPAPKYPHTNAGEALRVARTSWARVQSVRAEARVDQRGNEGRVRGTVLMMVERAGRLRFDAMTQFGPAAIVTANPQTFAHADLRENVYTTGPTCTQTIARLVGFPMTLPQVIELLLGGTFVIDHDRRSVRWHEDGFYRIELSKTGGQRQVIDLAIHPDDINAPVAQQRLQLAGSELFGADGSSRWRARYDDYEPIDGVPLPHRVHVEQRGGAIDTLIRFKQIEIDVALPEAAFAQTPRQGMTHEVATCDAQPAPEPIREPPAIPAPH